MQGGIIHYCYPLSRDYRYGGGASGGGGSTYNNTFGSGGGRSAIRRGNIELATAGGGGGGGFSDNGGHAGGANGLPFLVLLAVHILMVAKLIIMEQDPEVLVVPMDKLVMKVG